MSRPRLLILCIISCLPHIVTSSKFIPARLASHHTKSSATLYSRNEIPIEEITSVTRGGASSTRGGSQAMTFTSRQLKVFNLLSGGVAGTIASCITNPLEVIKTQLQASSAKGVLRGSPRAIFDRILETDGIGGFWRGLPPTLVGVIPARSAYFYAYESTKRALSPVFKEGEAMNSIISGFAAGIAGNTLTNPIWLVKTRMQLLADASAGQRAYTGYRDAISVIAKEEGIGGFYKGMTASYWGCAEGCIQFMIYEKLKNRLLAKQNGSREEMGLEPLNTLPKYMYFTSAAMAKCVAAITTYPHEVARTRLREQARGGLFKYNGMWPTLGIIAREEGRNGLYAGMGMHLCKVVPNSAIMFLCYEVVNSYLGQITPVEK